MNYCKKCVQVDTVPGIYFDDNGVCGACLWEEEKKTIDWKQRHVELEEISAWAKAQKSCYDCVIGVSGGKDSTRQALYMRDVMGLRPLLVSSEANDNTKEGLANIENIKRLGFDVISMRANPHIVRKLLRKDFFSVLNPNRALEYTLHSSVYIIADKFDIPLVVNGENSGQTLGILKLKDAEGDATQVFKENTIKEDYRNIYVDDDVSLEDLFMYSADMENVKRKGIKGVWLSNYMEDWGYLSNGLFSIKHGLTMLSPQMDPYALGHYRRFCCLDHPFISVNNHLKYIKFGLGFATLHASQDIRLNQITRDEAIFLVKEIDGKCSDEEVTYFCNLIDISEGEFWEHANSFRGPMWEKRAEEWILKNPIWEQQPIKGNYTVQSIMQRLGI